MIKNDELIWMFNENGWAISDFDYVWLTCGKIRVERPEMGWLAIMKEYGNDIEQWSYWSSR